MSLSGHEIVDKRPEETDWLVSNSARRVPQMFDHLYAQTAIGSISWEHLVYTERVGGPNLCSCLPRRKAAYRFRPVSVHRCTHMNASFTHRSIQRDYRSRFKDGDGPLRNILLPRFSLRLRSRVLRHLPIRRLGRPRMASGPRIAGCTTVPAVIMSRVACRKTTASGERRMDVITAAARMERPG